MYIDSKFRPSLRFIVEDAKFSINEFRFRHSRASRVAERNDDKNNEETRENTTATETTTATENDAKKEKTKKASETAEATEKTENDGKKKTSETVKKVEGQANDIGEASMNGGGHIKDKDPNVLDFSVFGVKMDMNKMSGKQPTQPNFDGVVNPPQPPTNPANTNTHYAPPANNPVYQFIPNQYAQCPQYVPPQPQAVPQPQTVPQPQVPPQPVQQQNSEATQPKRNLTPQEEKYINDIKMYEKQKEEAAKIERGKGNHKIDNPQPPKPPKVKAKEDNVNVDLDAVKVETEPPKPPKQWPDVVNNPLPKADNVEPEPIEPMFDNSDIESKYRYLADIENIALANNVQVKFLERVGLDGNPNGLISCISYTAQPGEPNKPNPYKGFTIDTGVIIDKRAKVFPAILESGYEDLQAYPVLIDKEDADKGKSKSKKVLNEKLFTDIFIGGVNALGPRGMYSPDFLDLNKCVSLITMPTGSMSNEIRKQVRDRLMNAMKAGVFASAFSIDPRSRFMFKDYDKKTCCFTLTNKGVPFRYGGQYLATKEIEIYFGIDEAKVVTIS